MFKRLALSVALIVAVSPIAMAGEIENIGHTVVSFPAVDAALTFLSFLLG